MSNANVTLVQSLYAAFARGDIETIIRAMAPDIKWRVEGRRKDYPTLGDFDGPAQVKGFFASVAQLQDATDFSPRDFFATGDRVFVLGHYAWKLKKTGKTVDAHFAHVFMIKNGKVSTFNEFTDTAQFAEAYRG